MLSHLPYSPFGLFFNPAVSAVIMFYFISGYLMYFSFSKESIHPKAIQIRNFYIKRFLRLYPLYFLVLTFTVIAIYLFGKSDFVPLLNQDLSFNKLFLNYILVLNNYVFKPFIIHDLLPHPLIPPTWSLSTEIHFYALVPFLYFLLKKDSKLFYIIFIFSMLFEFTSFAFTLPQFNSDNFGYRYIFGVLWVFMFGFLFAHNKKSKFIKAVYLFVVLYFMFIGFYFSNHPYVREILLAVLFTPLILKIKDIPFKYDRFFGQLSYPVFISHFFIFYISSKITHNKFIFFALVFALLLVFTFILAKIQDVIDMYRKKY